MIDTHTHIDSEDFDIDLEETISRAKDAGVEKVFLPAIDYASSVKISGICASHQGFCYPMYGLHPEEVKDDWKKQTALIRQHIDDRSLVSPIAVGEVGLDLYWSREFEKEQMAAFEEQITWSVELHLPLMIHCRKAQNEMVKILRRYENELVGGVFHCFTGNEHEAAELLEFERFALGIGGVSTFKKSKLPTTLPHVVPLSRIVLETDAPYMAPEPNRGKRNEPSFVKFVCNKLAEAYNVSPQELDRITTENAERMFMSNTSTSLTRNRTGHEGLFN